MKRFVVKKYTGTFTQTPIGTEDQFERLILKYGRELFPHGHLINWKRKAKTRTNKGTLPDLVLFSQDLSSWWIVEVEITKNDSYVEGHIATQLYKQSGADWKAISDKLIQPLEILGYSKKECNQLTSSDPKYLLITDSYSELVHEVARVHNFSLFVADPLINEQSKYALQVTYDDLKMKPPSSGDFFDIGYGPGDSPELGGGWWVVVPKHIIKLLDSDESVMLEMDGKRQTVTIHELATTWKMNIPTSQNDKNDSNRVLNKTADARFHVISDDGITYIRMTIERRYT
tara:strand:- start:5068 stop:5928 length:861 start_codon:yes stop_codon:yes gene_type:complete